jgi:hypothetical protein
MHVRRGRLVVADQRVLGIDVDVVLVTEVALAVLLGPAGIGVLLPALGRIPVLGHLAGLDAAVLLAAVALDRHGDDRGVDDPAPAGFQPGLRQVVAEPLEQPLDQLQLLEPLAKPPHGRAVRHAVVHLQIEEAHAA